MFGPLRNSMRLQALRASAGRFETRYGLVKNYDPNTYCVKVTLQPEGSLTGNIPLATAWVGNGWGMFCPPSIGDEVAVTFFHGSLNAGYAELRFFNNVDRPLPVASGEFWLVHAKGQFLKLTNEGMVIVADGQGAQVQMDGAGNINSQANQWNHVGPMAVDGNVNVTGTVAATIDVTGGNNNVSLVGHDHGGVQSGSSNTGPPNP